MVTFSSIIHSLKAMSLILHTCCELKSFNYRAITIEFVNCLPTKFNGDILFELPHVCHPLGHSEQLQGMDKNFNDRGWCKLQTSNIKNLFGLAFKTTKCLGHLCCHNDSCPLFQHFHMRNEISWSGDNSLRI
jgi:hypothetical protein